MFRAPTGAGLPSFATMLQDLPTSPLQLARHLDITPRTMQRYQATGEAPRVVMLAMFWETRWGRSAADCEAANWAALHYRRAMVAERETAALHQVVRRMERELDQLGGAANAPVWYRA